MPEETEVIDAPVETPEPEPFNLPEGFADTVKGWDIPLEAIPEAVQQYKSLQTEEGVIDAFIATGQSLGFGLKDLNRLFQDEVAPGPSPAPAAAPEPQLDPERLMSAAEVQELLDRQAQSVEARFNEQAQKEQQAVHAQVNRTIYSWFDANDVKDEQVQRMIANFGEKHILPTMDGTDPRVVQAALAAGKAEYDAWVQAEAQRYLTAKGATAAAQPTAVGGTPAHTQTQDETPFSYEGQGQGAMAAAKERVRQRMRQLGELE